MTPEQLAALDAAATQGVKYYSGADGDCWRACLATITGIPADTMPNFQFEPGISNGDEGRTLAREWLAPFGLTIFDTWVHGSLSLARVLNECSAANPGVPIILSGWSSNGSATHAVVIQDGAIIHDPSGADLSGPMTCNCGDPGCTAVHWGLEIIVPRELVVRTEPSEADVDRVARAISAEIDLRIERDTLAYGMTEAELANIARAAIAAMVPHD